METKKAKRLLKFEKLVRVKESSGYYNIPESIRSPKDAYNTIIEVLKLDEEAQEVFGIACLNAKNRVISIDKISVGTINSTLVHPREVFKVALMKNAARIVAFHNHPSGDPTPSDDDLNITSRLMKAGEIIGIELLDHIIIGDGEFVSLKNIGEMD